MSFEYFQRRRLAFVELHDVLLCLSLQPVETSLNGSTVFWCNSTEPAIISKPAEGAPCAFIQVINEKLNNTGPSTGSWGTPLAAGFQPDSVLHWALPFLIFLAVHLYYPHFLSILVRILWETVLKALLKYRQTTSIALLSSAQLVILSEKVIRLVKQYFLLVKLCCLPLIIFLSSAYLEMAARFITFLGT